MAQQQTARAADLAAAERRVERRAERRTWLVTDIIYSITIK